MEQWYVTLFANFGREYGKESSAQADVFGCRLGQFSREHALTHDDFEMLVVAEQGPVTTRS